MVYGDLWEAGHVHAVRCAVYRTESEAAARQLAFAAQAEPAPVASRGRLVYLFEVESDGWSLAGTPAALESLAPLSAGQLKTEPGTDPEMEDALVAALQSAALSHLEREIPSLKRFGQALLTDDYQLVRVQPLLAGSRLLFRIHTNNTNYASFSRIGEQLVWLIPFGRQASVLSSAPIPSVAARRYFAGLLRLWAGSGRPAAGLRALSTSLWLRVSTSSLDFVWPAVLAVTQLSAGPPLSALASDDQYSQLTQAMERLNNPDAGLESEQGNEQLHAAPQTMVFGQQAYPVPPTPAATSYVPFSTPLKTPAQIQTAASGPLWGSDEDEEVTVADFNYFDTPTIADPSQPNSVAATSRVDEDAEPKKEPSPTSKSLSQMEMVPNDDLFAPVKLDPIIAEADTKYASGGRFFSKVADKVSLKADSSTPESSTIESESETDFEIDTAAWKALPNSVSPTDAKTVEDVQALMVQVVWDDGLLLRPDDVPLVLGQSVVLHGEVPDRLRHKFPGLSHCELVPAGAQTAGRPNHDSFKKALHLLSPPLFTFNRLGRQHKSRAAILRFWSIFGLQPCGMPRDIRVILMTLGGNRAIAGAHDLLTLLRQIYAGCGLGSIDLPTFGDVNNGVLPIAADFDYLNVDTANELFETACSTLKRQLADHGCGPTILIMACHKSNHASLIPLARGYLGLKACNTSLQWLLSAIENLCVHPDTDFVPSRYWLTRLSLLLYDRWVNRTDPGPTESTAFSLARLAPSSLSIRYSPEPSPNLLDEDFLMHVSYNLSADKTWMVAAWTDQWASTTKIRVIRVREKACTRGSSPDSTEANCEEVESEVVGDKLLHAFSDVWRRTIQHCAQQSQNSSARWRVVIARCNSLPASEAHIWRAAVAMNTASALTSTSIPSINQPLLHLASLPNPNGLLVSCDDAMFAQNAGPPAEDSADSVIVDRDDETYGVELQPLGPLIAGLLIKPASKRGYALILEVCLHEDVPPQLLKRVLGQYRRLASLAEYTGVTMQTTILPWHVAATQKMVAALETLV